MKKFIYILSALLLLSACSERLPVGSEVKSCVYLLKTGEQKLTITSETDHLDIWVCKGGYDSERYSVTAVSDDEDAVRYTAETKKSYPFLPGNCYEVQKNPVVLDKDNIKAPIRIDLDPDCISKGTTFLFPVRISCDRPSAISNGKNIVYLLITLN